MRLYEVLDVLKEDTGVRIKVNDACVYDDIANSTLERTLEDLGIDTYSIVVVSMGSYGEKHEYETTLIIEGVQL